MPVGGIFGIAAVWPLASLGPRPGNALYHTKWYAGARLVTEDGRALTVDDVMVDGLMTVWPEGFIDNPESAAILVNIGGAPVEPRPGQEGFEVVSGRQRPGCLLQGLYPRRLRRQFVQRAFHAAHLSLPPIDVQHPPGLQAGVRPRVETAPPAPAWGGAGRLPDRSKRLYRADRPGLLEQVR